MTAAEPRVRKDHNGGITGDIFSKHVRAMAKLEKDRLDVSAKIKAAKAAAKDDGVNVADMQEAVQIAAMDPQAVIDRENRKIQYLKWLRADVGEQMNFIDDIGDSTKLTDEQRTKKWRNEGYQAGLAGANRDTCPHDPNSEAGRAWGEGYQEGQDKNLSGISDGAGTKAVAEPGKKGRGRQRAAPANDPVPPEAGEPDASAETGDDDAPVPPSAKRPTDAEFEAGGLPN